jgi:hypothetical protein
MEDPTLKEKEEAEELERKEAKEERFLTFASKHYPDTRCMPLTSRNKK